MATKRPKMDIANRAKQFMPFDALSGFREALEQKEKILVPRAELSEDYQLQLDEKMHQVHKNSMVTVVYFEKGEYIRMTGMVSRLDVTSRILQVVNTKISFDDIYDISLQQ